MKRAARLVLLLAAVGTGAALILLFRPSDADVALRLLNRRTAPGGTFVLHATFGSFGAGAIRDDVRPVFRDVNGRDLGLSLADVVAEAGLPSSLGRTCDYRVDRATLEARGDMPLEAQASRLRLAVDSGEGLLLERDFQRLEGYIAATEVGNATPLLECGGEVGIERSDLKPERVRVTSVLRVLPRTPLGQYQLTIPGLFYKGVPLQDEARWKVWVE